MKKDSNWEIKSARTFARKNFQKIIIIMKKIYLKWLELDLAMK